MDDLVRSRPWVRWGSPLALAVLAIGVIWGAEFLGESVVIGLTQHAPLILAALGFALIYRLTGLINVAYSETLTLGAYFGWWINTTFGLNFYATLLPTAVMSGLLSVATYFAIFRPAKKRNVGNLEMIIVSFGLSIFLRYGLQVVFGYPVRFYDVGSTTTIRVLGVGVSSFRLLALASVLILAFALYLFIQKSNYGLQIRALAGDENLAQASGIRPLFVTVVIWFIAGVAGGLAGAFYGVGSNVAPFLGWRQFLFIFLVVMVGGRKSIGGVILAGIGTGVALAAMSLKFSQTLYAQMVLIIAFIVILKVRGRRIAESGKV
ncbi:MAG: branched-chain amino acid ABC transporter permease [Acidimicrobiia bacterium]|nr:branched-chain amino acid ABC transporter permease [Acidimicrobiia bacterium]